MIMPVIKDRWGRGGARSARAAGTRSSLTAVARQGGPAGL